MKNRDVVLKSVQFIEDNLKADISVLDMANSVYYSLYHFIRLFQSVTGFSPKTYLQQRRLTESIKDLKKSDKKIIEIAYDYQFNSHEAFTRSFKKQFGISPSQIRNGISLADLPAVNPITKDYIYQSEKTKNTPPEIIELSQKILTGISFFLADDSKVMDLSNEWNQLMHEVENIKNRLMPERFYQVQYWSENQELGGLYFFIGVEVNDIDEVPPQFVIKIIPKSRYLRFVHKGLANKVGYTYKYIYNQFLPETDYKLNKPFNFEFYGEKCLGPYNPESESEIFIPIE
ncbi:MAG: AraC family transcriptional regulator [Calditrichaceae bacterium]